LSALKGFFFFEQAPHLLSRSNIHRRLKIVKIFGTVGVDVLYCILQLLNDIHTLRDAESLNAMFLVIVSLLRIDKVVVNQVVDLSKQE
jgi:hypothetical protein